MRGYVLTFLVLVLYALHQDLWNWTSARPLVLGFVPIGLFYHAAYSAACALLMTLLVRFAWPGRLERLARNGGGSPGRVAGQEEPVD